MHAIDHAGDLDTRRSTSGVLFYLGENPVSWSSQKQKIVTLLHVSRVCCSYGSDMSRYLVGEAAREPAGKRDRESAAES